MSRSGIILIAAAIISLVMLFADGRDTRADVRDATAQTSIVPDQYEDHIESDTTLIESGGGFGGGYRSRIESVVQGDSVGL